MTRLLFIVLISLLFGNVNPSNRFIDKYIERYRSETHLRPTDSLLYVPKVMNLSRNIRAFERDYKNGFFKYLSRGRVLLTYPLALDIDSGESYHNPRGDLDYWENTSGRITLVHDKAELLHERYKTEIGLLVSYVKERHPDYLFTISEAVGLDFELYWAIIGHHMYAIEFNIDENRYTEYDAQEYINEIAPDYVFLSGLRLMRM